MIPSTTVRCSTCQRIERWSGAPGTPPTVEVVVPGGDRRPSEHPSLAAWRVLRRSRNGGGPVVTRCAMCDQPALANDDVFPTLPSWELTTPQGVLSIAADIRGPSGTMSEDEAERWLESQLGPRRGPIGGTAVHLLMLLMLLVPFVLWIFGAVYLFFFIWVGLLGMS